MADGRSSTAPRMIAGTMLADTVAGATDPGDAHTLWRYQSAFMGEFGELLISYDGIRRTSSALGSEGVTEMIHAGLLNPTLSKAGLGQRPASPVLTDLPGMASRLARRPKFAAKLLGLLARSAAAGASASR